MADKKISKELQEVLDDPEMLKKMGLQKSTSDDALEEIFAPIKLDEDATLSDIERQINERSRKQMEYVRNIVEQSKAETTKVLDERDKSAEDKRIDNFLEKYPWLNTNKALLDEMSPLYNSSGDLEKAYHKACKLCDINPKTGKKASSDQSSASEKVTQQKSDTASTELQAAAEQSTSEGVNNIRSIREIIASHSNNLAAEGKNPFRENKE